MSPLAACIPLASLILTAAPVQAQTKIIWEAYNDYRPTGLTHENVSEYDLRLTDDGGSAFQLRTSIRCALPSRKHERGRRVNIRRNQRSPRMASNMPSGVARPTITNFLEA